MKQHMHGRRVQNWHRPPGPRQLTRWFQRHRHDEPPDTDDDWCDDDDDLCYYSEREIGAMDRRIAELRGFLRAAWLRPSPLFPINPPEEPAAPPKTNRQRARLAGERIEQRLAAFIRGVTRPFISSLIDAATRRPEDMRVLRQAATAFGADFANHVCLFAPFWLRRPSSWRGDDASSLLMHLFARYEAPAFLLAPWSRPLDFPKFKWTCWFILLAQGGSLQRAGKRFGWNIGNGFEHALRAAPARRPPEHAALFAEVLRLGGTGADCRRLLANRTFAVDPTEPFAHEAYEHFWNATIRWLIKHAAEITDAQCARILDWATHEHTEARRIHGRFSWKGRTPRAVLQRAQEYAGGLQKRCTHSTWPARGWSWHPPAAALADWRFVELTSSEMLWQEGQALQHCVGGYAFRCAAGESVIVALRQQNVPKATIEIAPKSRTVVQARGQRNRPVTFAEQCIIDRWLAEVVMKSK